MTGNAGSTRNDLGERSDGIRNDLGERSDGTRNGGDVVAETLTALGVSHVFGIPGQNALGLFDAIRRSELTFVSSRVENNS
ncbi:thiamine pyrophosphate-binding protein, partial [Mycolicibacterium sp.]|uniref:thiamine pyrophosphate-binding protein n=1 Tax=Mycolicibacterium sp. TaxID=2320850 RepID=UPI003D0CB849